MKIRPHFKKNNFCCVFATNDNYAPYLSIAIMSLILNVSENNLYDICIMYTNISNENKKLLKKLETSFVSIRFINVNNFFSKFDGKIFTTHWHFTKETYYRFFIQDAFEGYEKIIYLDCDMIFLSDIQNLATVDMGCAPMAAVEEFRFKITTKKDSNIHTYAKEILKLTYVEKYFNAGVLVINLEKLQSIAFSKKCIEKLREIKNPRNVDQCILNALFNESVHLLDAKWNVQTHLSLHELQYYTDITTYAKYETALQSPCIVHYCSNIKPWNTKDIPFGDAWWHVAEKTLSYKNLLKEYRKITT